MAATAILACPAYIRNLRAAPPPLKLGFIAPLTGPFGAEAQDQVRGAAIAVSEFNAAGGLAGRLAELVVRDDKLNPGEAATRTLELVEKERIDALVGGLGASVQLAINNITRERKVLFSSIGQSDAINEAKDFSPLTFHEALTPHMSVGAVARHAFANLGKRAALLTADYAFGNEAARAVNRVAKETGAEILADIRHPLGQTDYSTVMPRIESLKPDVLFLLNFGRDQMISAKQTGDFGLRRSMRVVAPVLAFYARVAGGPDAYDGIVGSSPYYWRLEETVPSARAFNDRFRAANAGADPSDYAAVAYSGARTVLSAMTAAGTSAADKVAEALRALKYDHYKGPQLYRTCDQQSVQRVFLLESKRDGATPQDVFTIIGGEGPDEAMLRSCEELGHAKG
jgi:branched-chain amino acid transport system substrate-binding protein